MFDKNRCLSCKYSSFNNELICNYILIEGHRRGCYEGICTKYEERKTQRRQKIVFGKGVELYDEHF